jgi:hypothetical protein
VRWERLVVDVSGLERQSDALERVGEALEEALEGAAGRLLATRLVFRGATGLHGALARDLPALRAQCQAKAHEAGGDRIWIEEVTPETTPLYDPARLAERDDLTRILLDTLDAAAAGDLESPAEVRDMMKVLPGDIRGDLELELTGDGRVGLLADVRAILLDALSRKGGDA